MDTKALRQKVLDLAIRGKLVPQDPNDEPASVLLERIRLQKQQMVKEGKLKPKDIKNDTIIFVGEDSLHYEKFADGSVKCIEDEIPFDLPDGWQWARLGCLAQYKKGPFGSSITKAMFIQDTPDAVALDDTWNYADILWNGIQAEKVQRAFEKLNYREQTLLEKRLAICMTCGRVGSWKNRHTFEELAVMFEGSTASGAERAYRKAVDKLTELLVAEGSIHAVRLKQKSKTKRKKKIAAAIYEYQADCDGEWGEISFDFENGTAEIIRLADWDTTITNRFANRAIAYLLNCENEKLPKETIVAFEA